MTAEIAPIRAVADTGGNSGNSGNNPRLALLTAPGTETDHFAVDCARDVALSVLDAMQREEGVTPQATEAAVRVLLLAAAELRWDITIAGRGLLLSTMMMAGLDELRDDLVTPPTYDQAA